MQLTFTAEEAANLIAENPNGSTLTAILQMPALKDAIRLAATRAGVPLRGQGGGKLNTEGDRQILSLFDSGVSVSDIAEATGLSANAVRSSVMREKLRQFEAGIRKP